MGHYTKWQNAARIILGLGLIVAGIAHLTFARLEFQAQVPNWVPLSKDLTVVLSGLVEVVFGALLLFGTRNRRSIGWATALLFVLVFPGNIAQYLNGTSAFGLDSDGKRLARLFFQPLLVVWALWCCGSWTRRRD